MSALAAAFGNCFLGFRSGPMSRSRRMNKAAANTAASSQDTKRQMLPAEAVIVEKRKGLQLALEPLNGRGIAGYVPEPKLWTWIVRPKSRGGNQ